MIQETIARLAFQLELAKRGLTEEDWHEYYGKMFPLFRADDEKDTK